MKYDRVYNFSAGPAMMPEPVLEEIRDEMMNYQGSGMCVMEMSHRSKVFAKIAEEAEQDLRDLMGIPDNYKVLFPDNNEWHDDEFSDDSALVFDGKNGLTIITGCSHSGICNIIEYAKNHFQKRIENIIGGFHLLEINDQVMNTIAYLKKQRITNLYPCHCTSLHVKSKMIEEGLNVIECGSGLELNIE